MKRIISVVLILLTILTFAVPAYAEGANITKTAAPKLSSASYTDLQTIKVKWKAVDGADGYRVYRKEKETDKWKKLEDVKSTSYTDKNAKDGKTYYYTVRGYVLNGSKKVLGSYDKKGLSCYSKLAAPKLKSAKQTALGTVEIKWKKTAGASGYRIYRKEKGAKDWSKLAVVTGTSYTDQTATIGKTYVYSVRPQAKLKNKTILGRYDKTGLSVKSEFSAPKLVSAKSVGYKMIEIKWKKADGAKNYRVMRKKAGAKKWTTIAKNISGLSYTDSTAEVGTTYVYTVRGTAKMNGETILSNYSSEGIKVTSVFQAPQNLTAKNKSYNKITLKWDAVPGANKYQVYCRTSPKGSWKKIKSTYNTSYTHTVNCGTTYYYTVRAYYKGDKTVYGEYHKDVKCTASPSTPVLKAEGAEAVIPTVNWEQVAGADGYYVYRKTSGGSWKKLADTKQLSYTDKNAELNVKYAYTVKAYTVVNGKNVYSGYNKKGISLKRIRHVHFRQGDTSWGFSRSLRKKACVLTSFSMLLKNLGEDTNPKKTYKANGNNSGMYFGKALKYYDRKYVPAISKKSSYYSSYDETYGYTYIKNPQKNAVKAIKEALDRNPEGVMCYFVRGSHRHAIVAIGYSGNTIYYSDPGRVSQKGYNVPLSGTWCVAGHNMSYKHLNFIMAID